MAFLPDGADARRVGAALAPVLAITWCDQPEQLLAAVGRAQVVVTAPLDDHGAPVISTIAELRARAPHLPIIAYTSLAPEHVRALVGMATAVLFAVVIRGVDDSRARLRSLVDDAMVATCEQHLWEAILPLVPASVRAIVHYCVQESRGPLSVAGVADALGLPARTMAARLHRASLPGPQELIAWCRLIRVACLLHDQSLTLDAVAQRLGFPSVAAVHALVTRTLGMSPRSLRLAGATTRAVAALQTRFLGTT